MKYADVLLRKDAVQTLNRQLAIHQLTAASGTAAGTASEVIESPPAALTAAKTLSPAEREGIVQALDDLLDRQQYQQYRDGVLQLYCDGLVSWGELQQCWAAAEAGAELAAAAAAAEGPIALAGREGNITACLKHLQLTSALGMDNMIVGKQTLLIISAGICVVLNLPGSSFSAFLMQTCSLLT